MLTETEAATQLGEGQPRTFVWFTPARRKPTEYELYTVGQQSGPQDWLDVDWPLRFDNGRAPVGRRVQRRPVHPLAGLPRPARRSGSGPTSSASNQDEQALGTAAAGSDAGVGGRAEPDLVERDSGRAPTRRGRSSSTGCSSRWPTRCGRLARTPSSSAWCSRPRTTCGCCRTSCCISTTCTTRCSGFSDAGAREAWMTDPALTPDPRGGRAAGRLAGLDGDPGGGHLVFEPHDRPPGQDRAVRPPGVRRSATPRHRPCWRSRSPTPTGHWSRPRPWSRLVCEDPEHGAANRGDRAGMGRRVGQRCAVAAEAFLPTFTVCGIDAEERPTSLSRAVAKQQAAAAGAGIREQSGGARAWTEVDG